MQVSTGTPKRQTLVADPPSHPQVSLLFRLQMLSSTSKPQSTLMARLGLRTEPLRFVKESDTFRTGEGSRFVILLNRISCTAFSLTSTAFWGRFEDHL